MGYAKKEFSNSNYLGFIGSRCYHYPDTEKKPHGADIEKALILKSSAVVLEALVLTTLIMYLLRCAGAFYTSVEALQSRLG